MHAIAAFGVSAKHGWGNECPAYELSGLSWEPSCTAMAPIGGGGGGHMGLRYGLIGFEGFLFGLADYSKASLEGEPPVELPSYVNDNHIGRAGVAAGVAARLFIPLGGASLTASAGGGAAWRSVFSNVSSLEGKSEQYFAPLMRADLGLVVLGIFTAGIQGWVEFTPDVAVTPDLSAVADSSGEVDIDVDLGSIAVFGGPEFFIGPYAGLAFGEKPQR